MAVNVNKASKQELINEIRRLDVRINKRLERINKTFDKGTDASRYFTENRKNVTTSMRGRNGQQSTAQLRRQLALRQDFLNKKTSSVGGENKVRKATVSTLSKMGINVSKDDVRYLFEQFDKYAETHKGVKAEDYKYEIISRLSKVINNPEKLNEMLLESNDDMLEAVYKEQEEPSFSTSDFYGTTLGEDEEIEDLLPLSINSKNKKKKK